MTLKTAGNSVLHHLNKLYTTENSYFEFEFKFSLLPMQANNSTFLKTSYRYIFISPSLASSLFGKTLHL